MNDEAKFRKQAAETEPAVAAEARPDLGDPNVVLSLLEADQVVAAKTHTRFGPRKLSVGMRAMLWGMRIYVFVMLVIVLISVLRALHRSP
ncbi:MAG TPA: hypothetical protein VGR81_08565 [Candidatus Acidoferrales bacterium]|nr:hypothetical protein [Candidatus Acidoferrales bacterium]